MFEIIIGIIKSIKEKVQQEQEINLMEFEMDYLKYELGKYEK